VATLRVVGRVLASHYHYAFRWMAIQHSDNYRFDAWCVVHRGFLVVNMRHTILSE
jgi:hypothetical protein